MDMMQKIIKRFDVTYDNSSSIGQKADAHVLAVKQLEQQFSQLSTISNPC